MVKWDVLGYRIPDSAEAIVNLPPKKMIPEISCDHFNQETFSTLVEAKESSYLLTPLVVSYHFLKL